MVRDKMIQEFELGWRAAGAAVRENEGPAWMRRLIISHRCYDRSDYGGPKSEWHDRPANQMM